ncbi:MAG TPA: hypothetical protein VMM13_11865 [Euzebya sp.]|nr:hypothetical protein [Euzebya sp.]
MSTSSGLTVGKVSKAAGPLIPLAFMLNCTIVAIAALWVNTPVSGNTFADFPGLIPGAIMPVIGNAFGFFMSYRKPSRASLPLFLTIGAVISAIFVVLAVRDFGDHDNLGLLITVVLLTLAPVVVVVLALLSQKDALVGSVAAPRSAGLAAQAPQIPQLGQPAAAAPQIPPLGQQPAALGAPGQPVAHRTGQWNPSELGGEAGPGTRSNTPPAGQPVIRTQKWSPADLAGAGQSQTPQPGTPPPAQQRPSAPPDPPRPQPAPRETFDPTKTRKLDVGLPRSPVGPPVEPDEER